jgi:hypothetical protein
MFHSQVVRDSYNLLADEREQAKWPRLRHPVGERLDHGLPRTDEGAIGVKMPPAPVIVSACLGPSALDAGRSATMLARGTEGAMQKESAAGVVFLLALLKAPK